MCFSRRVQGDDQLQLTCAGDLGNKVGCRLEASARAKVTAVESSLVLTELAIFTLFGCFADLHYVSALNHGGGLRSAATVGVSCVYIGEWSFILSH